jgi:hypothetical protein
MRDYGSKLWAELRGSDGLVGYCEFGVGHGNEKSFVIVGIERRTHGVDRGL